MFVFIYQEKEQKKQQQMMIRAIESQRKQEVGNILISNLTQTNIQINRQENADPWTDK